MNLSHRLLISLLLAGLTMSVSVLAETVCPPVFQFQMKKLHSSEVLDLCEVTAGHPVLL